MKSRVLLLISFLAFDCIGQTNEVKNRDPVIQENITPQPTPKRRRPIPIQAIFQNINWLEENEKANQQGTPKLYYEAIRPFYNLNGVYLLLSVRENYDPKGWKNGEVNKELLEYASQVYEALVEVNKLNFVVPALQIELQPVRNQYWIVLPNQSADQREEQPHIHLPEKRLRVCMDLLREADFNHQNLIKVLNEALGSGNSEYTKLTKRKILEAYEAYKSIGSGYKVVPILPAEDCPEVKDEIFNLKVVDPNRSKNKNDIAAEKAAFAHTLFENKMISSESWKKVQQK